MSNEKTLEEILEKVIVPQDYVIPTDAKKWALSKGHITDTRGRRFSTKATKLMYLYAKKNNLVATPKVEREYPLGYKPSSTAIKALGIVRGVGKLPRDLTLKCYAYDSQHNTFNQFDPKPQNPNVNYPKGYNPTSKAKQYIVSEGLRAEKVKGKYSIEQLNTMWKFDQEHPQEDSENLEITYPNNYQPSNFAKSKLVEAGLREENQRGRYTSSSLEFMWQIDKNNPEPEYKPIEVVKLYLDKEHPEEMKKLAKLSGIEKLWEIGKLYGQYHMLPTGYDYSDFSFESDGLYYDCIGQQVMRLEPFTKTHLR